MSSEEAFTQSQEQVISALHGVYFDTEVTDEDRRRVNMVSTTGEYRLNDIEDVSSLAKVMNEKHGRYNALKMLYYNYRRMERDGGKLDNWYFLFMVEYLEVSQLFINDYRDTCLLRGCSFLEQYFLDSIDYTSYLGDGENANNVSLARLINFAKYEGDIDQTERKLLHFVRKVRNDSAHNSWLEKQFSHDALFHGGRCLIYLLREIIFRKTDETNINLPDFPVEIDPQKEYLNVIEDELGWSYDDNRQFWEAVEATELPPTMIEPTYANFCVGECREIQCNENDWY